MQEKWGIERGGRGDPYERAYRGLRRDLVTGAVLPGDQIVVIEAAKRLGISPTPVREALAHLAGERLIEDRRRHGYFVPLPSWFDLIELYDLCELHLVAALREAGRSGASAPVGATEVEATSVQMDPLGEKFAAVMCLSRNTRLVLAGCSFIDCLAAARRFQAGIYGEDEALAALSALLSAGDWRQAVAVLCRILRRCRSHAEPVARAMAAAHRARNRADIV